MLTFDFGIVFHEDHVGIRARWGETARRQSESMPKTVKKPRTHEKHLLRHIIIYFYIYIYMYFVYRCVQLSIIGFHCLEPTAPTLSLPCQPAIHWISLP